MTNGEAVGYAVIALRNTLKAHCKSFPETKKLIKDTVSEMYYQFDMKTEDEAAAIGDIIATSDSEEELQERLKDYYNRTPDKIVQVKKEK